MNNQINIATVERAASVIGGSLLIYSSFRRLKWSGIGIAVAGAALIHRGFTGHSDAYQALGVSTKKNGNNVSVPYGQGIRVSSSITVNKPRFEVYSFWRDLENLPSFMQHLERVRETGPFASHWEAKAPIGRTVQWDAEVITDDPGAVIAWRSLPGADVDNAGSVHFRDAAGKRGTEVHVELSYVPPGGVVGAWLSKALGESPKSQIQQDLRRFKMMIETGEVPQTQHENRQTDARAKQAREADVQSASEASFPASDAPAWG
jgi:uncharacterized membrane protein